MWGGVRLSHCIFFSGEKTDIWRLGVSVSVRRPSLVKEGQVCGRGGGGAFVYYYIPSPSSSSFYSFSGKSSSPPLRLFTKEFPPASYNFHPRAPVFYFLFLFLSLFPCASIDRLVEGWVTLITRSPAHGSPSPKPMTESDIIGEKHGETNQPTYFGVYPMNAAPQPVRTEPPDRPAEGLGWEYGFLSERWVNGDWGGMGWTTSRLALDGWMNGWRRRGNCWVGLSGNVFSGAT